jgi:hypothetical protein
MINGNIILNPILPKLKAIGPGPGIIKQRQEINRYHHGHLHHCATNKIKNQSQQHDPDQHDHRRKQRHHIKLINGLKREDVFIVDFGVHQVA